MQYRLWSAAVLSIALAGCPDSQRQKQAARVPGERAEEIVEPVFANDPRFANSDVSAADIAGAYKKFRLMTPREGVAVNPGLAMLCRGATEREVKAAQIKDGVHANSFITIYMNSPAAMAFEQHKHAYPPGSVIVKAKTILGYRKDSYPYESVGGKFGVGGMIKRPAGYDSDHGDWEYFYFEDPLQIQTGKLANCIACHAGGAEMDHVFGSWARGNHSR
jgi:hypothetical protein